MKTPINQLVITLMIFSPTLHGKVYSQAMAEVTRIEASPRIDGYGHDSIWDRCVTIEGFRTHSPYHGRPASFPSQVKMAYDDKGIYILAMMWDPSPDSIQRQLGNRDDELNADHFGIGFDTYGKYGDAYFFEVTASGVQSDYRRSDLTYDAVWKSAVSIIDSGWIVEISIPYSALRFPSLDQQEWGLQLYRYIRRKRELSQWALEEKGTANELVYWGKIGMKGIDAPIRLSFTPFAGILHQYQASDENGQASSQTSPSGGLDLKLGLNEAYTLDVTLLPDFSQVRSDNFIKNLSAYETVYDENRPFFNEGVDLFMRGDLLYSRRIGREPGKRYAVDGTLQSGEEIIDNPDRVKLINALKVSGRNKQGLALGIFNAITGKADAHIQDSLGNTRKFNTEPLANYNILVADQQFHGNSAIYLINTNVMRNGIDRDANVSEGGLTLANANNMYEIEASAALSQVFFPIENGSDNKNGYRYAVAFSKVKGRFHASLSHSRISKDFDINDMGLIHKTGLAKHAAWVSYRVYEPFGPFLEMRNSVEWSQTTNLEDKSNENSNLYYTGYTALRNYLSLWWGSNYAPFDRTDHYEARTKGQVFVRPGYINGNLGFSSDYRKPFALDGRAYLAKDFDTYRESSFTLTPIFRINNRLSFNADLTYNEHQGVKGFVRRMEDNVIIFGQRSMNTYINSVSARYMFKADFSLALWIRHYWQEGWYQQYFSLMEDGSLMAVGYDSKHDYSYNSLNMDLSCSWVFAPGSLLSIVWKSALLEERNTLMTDYFSNLRYLSERPQSGLFSIKFVYYLDYATLTQSRHS